MKIKSMHLVNFKNIRDAEINFKSTLSGIYGVNGSGKTAIIEALQVCKEFFVVKDDEKFLRYKKKILNYIRNGEARMSMSIVLDDNVNEYKFTLEFILKSDNDNSELYIDREIISSRRSKSKNKWKSMIDFQKDVDRVLPKILLNNRVLDFEDDFNFGNLVITNFMRYNSMSALVIQHNLFVSDDNFDRMLTSVVSCLKNISVISVDEQALCNLNMLIIMHAHLDESNKIFPVHMTGDSTQYYDEKVATLFKDVIDQINPFFSIVIPGARLLLEKLGERSSDDDVKQEELKLYVERGNQKNPIEKESVGTIKIISILSSLIAVIQSSNTIVAIDELDAHIFEYLLSIILKHVQVNIKGQLIFTAHNLTLLENLQQQNIIISTVANDDVIYTYLKKVSDTTNLRNTYIRSQSVWSQDNVAPMNINESRLKNYFSLLKSEYDYE